MYEPPGLALKFTLYLKQYSSFKKKKKSLCFQSLLTEAYFSIKVTQPNYKYKLILLTKFSKQRREGSNLSYLLQ